MNGSTLSPYGSPIVRHTLGYSIESTPSQTRRPCEVVIVDDGWTNAMEAVVPPFSNRHARANNLERAHSGATTARNARVWVSRGGLIVSQGSDDERACDPLSELNGSHRAAVSRLALTAWCIGTAPR